MKKALITTIILLTISGTVIAFRIKLPNQKITDVQIVTELPFNIEPFNPVPEVRTWDESGRTFYYFNWGIKPTGGYGLNFVELKDDLIVIQALNPPEKRMTIQIFTYPRLIVSLPKGTYRYRVIDQNKKIIKDFFKPNNPPLHFTLFLPHGDGIGTRQILRDPYENTTGKTTAEIALEALMSQTEVYELLEHEVTVEGVSFSKPDDKWVVLLSKSYDSLDISQQELLAELITKTVLAIKAEGLEQVEITTDPNALPQLE